MFEKRSVQALCLAILALGATHAAGREMTGEVTLTVSADRKQPAGWPVGVEVTVRFRTQRGRRYPVKLARRRAP